MIFYCGLMVHITDTRAQKVVSYMISVHYRNGVWTWPTLGGAKQFILTTAVSSFAKAQKMDNHTVGHYTTGVNTCPALRGVRHFLSTSYFFIAWCVHSVHTFLLHKSNTDNTKAILFSAYLLRRTLYKRTWCDVRNFARPLRNFWPVVVFQLFFFSK